MANDTDKGEDNSFIFTSIIVALTIIGLWFLTYISLKDDPDRGVFGDMFGSINSLFSGLALAGIILTILLQRSELKLQRDELRETRKEFQMQNETLKLQRFENTFFNLLNQHHQIVNAIDYRYYKKKEKEKNILPRRYQIDESSEEKEVVIILGRDVFRFRYNRLQADLDKTPSGFDKIYKIHYEDAQTDFGHYFRNIYRIIKLVDQTDFFYDTSQISETEVFQLKYRYTSILRAQLSDFELVWIFYNCLTSNGIEKFKPLIEKYSLLKNLPLVLISDKALVAKYKSLAFGQDRPTANSGLAPAGQKPA